MLFCYHLQVELLTLEALEQVGRQRVLEAGGLCLLRRLLLCNDFEEWAASEEEESNQSANGGQQEKPPAVTPRMEPISRMTAHIQKHSMRLLANLSLHPSACIAVAKDPEWMAWLESCAGRQNHDNKVNSHARAVLFHVSQVKAKVKCEEESTVAATVEARATLGAKMTLAQTLGEIYPRYEDCIFLLNSDSMYWSPRPLKQVTAADCESFLSNHVGFEHDSSYTVKVSFYFCLWDDLEDARVFARRQKNFLFVVVTTY